MNNSVNAKSDLVSERVQHTLRTYSICAILCTFSSALALICGVIPSLSVAGSNRPVAYFDMIRFLPQAGSVFAFCVLTLLLMNVIFTAIRDIPRIVCTVISFAELASLAASLIALGSTGVSVYADKLYSASPVLILEVLVSTQSTILAVLAQVCENRFYELKAQEHSKARLRSPSFGASQSTNRPDGMKNPEKLK